MNFCCLRDPNTEVGNPPRRNTEDASERPFNYYKTPTFYSDNSFITSTTYEESKQFKKKRNRKLIDVMSDPSMMTRSDLEVKYCQLERKYQSSQFENNQLRDEVYSLRSDLKSKDDIIAKLEKKHDKEIKDLKKDYDNKFEGLNQDNQKLKTDVSVLMNQFSNLALQFSGYVLNLLRKLFTCFISLIQVSIIPVKIFGLLCVELDVLLSIFGF